jgi:alpha-tubulin suppressor-like RCC1 family protein
MGQTGGLTSSGSAYCWGYNWGFGTSSPVPVAVAGGLRFTTLATGLYHTCGLTGSGAADCWGDNTYGQLGNGSYATSSIPVAVAGGLSFSALATSGDHICGLTGSGAAYCWGLNEFGQLGDGSSTTDSPIPVAVSGGLTFGALAMQLNRTRGANDELATFK